jgi:hypothetical protein
VEERPERPGKVVDTPGSALDADALDFWIGSWDVSWDGGHGTNTIRRILGDRVIEETFHGIDADGSFDGRSLSVRDVADGRWRQTWVDSNGAYLHFVGVEADGRIAFQRDAIIDGATGFQRMIWLDVTAKTLRWQWQRSRNGGTSWELLWEIHYERTATG